MNKQMRRINYILELYCDNHGKFEVRYSIPHYSWNKGDKIGIYENANKIQTEAKETFEVINSKGTYSFNVPVNPGYELRYYRGNAELYRTSIYPNIILGMTNDNYYSSAKANIQSMQLTYKNGCVHIKSNITDAEEDDFIGLYDSLLAENDDFLVKVGNRSFNKEVTTTVSISKRMFLRYVTKRESGLHMVRRTFQMLDEISVHEKLDEDLSENEKYDLLCDYPKLTLDLAKKTDENTTEYNCIAWSLGLDDRWINPLGSIEKMTQFYEMYGCKEETNSQSQKIDLWATVDLKPTHGSKIYKEAIEAIWESKLGCDIRLTHNRSGVENGTYGVIVKSFAEPSLTKQYVRKKREWSSKELNCINLQISKISLELQHEFKTRFLKWKDTWFTGSNQYTSNTNDLKEVKEYADVLELGKIVIPMIVKKLCDEENFPSLVLYDELQSNNLLKLNSEENFDMWIMGEQERATQTIVKWIEHYLN